MALMMCRGRRRATWKPARAGRAPCRVYATTIRGKGRSHPRVTVAPRTERFPHLTGAQSRERYPAQRKNKTQQTISALCGNFGEGETNLAATCSAPLLVPFIFHTRLPRPPVEGPRTAAAFEVTSQAAGAQVSSCARVMRYGTHRNTLLLARYLF